MVNADRVKRKLPSLLAGNCSNRKNKKGWNTFMRYRYRLEQFKKRNPEKYNTLTNKVVADLTEFEKVISNNNTVSN
ncbi:MAG: hypothetical protein ABSD92_11850 [Candidatus Bathyarchaeia archaeon]